jgi:hypothetical protein
MLIVTLLMMLLGGFHSNRWKTILLKAYNTHTLQTANDPQDVL